MRIAIANQKGGVGKTTTAVNLAVGLKLRGKRVLLIDMDAQANATSHLGFNPAEVETTIYDILSGSEMATKHAIINTQFGIDLMPSNLNLASAETEFLDEIGREKLLDTALEQIKGSYDYIIIDCPPSLGLLVINALSAADRVIIPVQGEYFAVEGLAKLLQIVSRVHKRVNPRLGVLGVLLTMVDQRRKLDTEMVKLVRERLSHYVFNAVIRRNVKLAEAAREGQPIFVYDSKSTGAEDYAALVDELLIQVGDV